MRNIAVLPFVSVGIALGACTLQSGIEQSALDYNRAADRVQKELLLLNVARANRGEGLTYTEIVEMRGNFTLQAQAQLSLPFGGAADPNFKLTPTGILKTNPSVQIRPLTTSQFQLGIASDVEPQTLLNLWERGWPREVLLHILLEKVVLTSKDKNGLAGKPCPIAVADAWQASPDDTSVECIFDNDPDDDARFKDFQKLLRAMRITPFQRTVSGKQVGPKVKIANLDKLRIVAQAHDGELQLQSNADGFHLKSPDKQEVSISGQKLNGIAVQYGFSDASQAKGIRGTLHLRSPEGTIVYLGELVRAQKSRNRITYQRIYDPECAEADPNTNVEKDAELDKCLTPLFVAWTGEGPAEISVQLKGTRLFIPSSQDKGGYVAGQSLLVMSLVRLLFNLNTSREDLPLTQTVVTTGGSNL